MKRIFAVLLVLVMVFSLAACGKKSESKPAGADKAGTETDAGAAPAGENAGMANPWVECTLDDIETYIGWRFGIPDGATDATFRWNETIGLAEMIYTVDGTEWCARMQKTDAFEDISGMNYELEEDSDNYGYGPENPIKDYAGDQYMGKQYLLETDEGTVNLGLWYYEKEGLMFSLGCVSPDGILLFNDRYAVFFPEGLNTDFDHVEDDSEAVSQQ